MCPRIVRPCIVRPRALVPCPSIVRRLTRARPASQLRDWLHVIASTKQSYELKYYNIHEQDADEDED